jgi:protein-S-isoprenylcysteine O-methyltransferase Ste14
MALQEELESQGNFLFKHRGTFPIIILAAGFLVFLQPVLYSNSFWWKDTIQGKIYAYICLLIALAGLVIRCYTVGHTPANTSGRNTEGQLADRLNTSGIYSTVRHPLYLGNFFMWLGPAMLTADFWFIFSFIFVYWVYYERIMFAEEQFLRKKFGDVYTSWASRTPAFIPSFKNFVKPDLPFSWKKILKKEKNGLVAVFLIFLLFYAAGCYFSNEPMTDYFMIYFTVFTVILYIILKYVKKYSTVLDEAGR